MRQITVTVGEAADLFGVSLPTLRAWFNAGAPAGDVDPDDRRRRVIDLGELLRWRLGQAGENELEGERIRLTRAQADRAELEAAEMAGELVRVAEVESEWSRMLGAVRSRLLALPSKAAPQARNAVNDLEAAALIEAEVFEALADLSGDGLPDKARSRRASAQS